MAERGLTSTYEESRTRFLEAEESADGERRRATPGWAEARALLDELRFGDPEGVPAEEALRRIRTVWRESGRRPRSGQGRA